MSDTRTNAGVDNSSITRKMFTWDVPGDRVITLMTVGNLATTQALVSVLDERSKIVSERNPTILELPTMFQIARLVGATLREAIHDSRGEGQQSSSKLKASVIVGGQIKGGAPTLFMIYPEGNFIEITDDNPFFQIGEAKYGKPILVRAYDPDMSFEDTIKLLLVSFDSTIRRTCLMDYRWIYRSMRKTALKPAISLASKWAIPISRRCHQAGAKHCVMH